MFRREFLDRFREFFPAAEVHRLADAGHYVVEDAHERIAPLIAEFRGAALVIPNSQYPIAFK